MKRVIVYPLCFLSIFVLAYGIGVFISLEPNILSWTEQGRFVYLVGCALVNFWSIWVVEAINEW